MKEPTAAYMIQKINDLEDRIIKIYKSQQQK